MKEHPIIFNTENVKAILDGRKTQTRRVIKFQPEPNHIEEFKQTWQGLCPYGQVGDRDFTYFKDSAPPYDGYYEVIWEDGDAPRFVYLRRHNEPDLPADIPTEHEWERWLWGKDEQDDPEAISLDIRNPELIQWRRVGDRLWVRETFVDTTGKPYATISNKTYKERIIYKADDIHYPIRWTSPLFMPRWASRITLEITEVRVEHLNQITEEDAKREGLDFDNIHSVNAFLLVWNKLNAKRGYGWETNPWVWVISFRRIEK